MMKPFLLATAVVLLPGWLLYVVGGPQADPTGPTRALAREGLAPLPSRGNCVLAMRPSRKPRGLAIDWSFIEELEGGPRQEAYVPANPRSGRPLGHSGVTVATGFDLGQHGEAELRRMGLEGTLLAKLRPYLGLRRRGAQAFLQRHPLVLTKEEVRELDEAARHDTVRRIEQAFDRARSPRVPPFARLDPAWQTILVSLAMQYGTHLDRRAPRLWHHVLEGRFAAAARELRRFGDAHRSRREREADLLQG